MLEDTTNLPNLAAWLVVLTAAAAGAVTDARERRLPNALTAPLFISGLVFAGMAGGLAGFGDSLLASMLLAAPYLVLFAVAAGGAGDAKMMAAVGACALFSRSTCRSLGMRVHCFKGSSNDSARLQDVGRSNFEGMKVSQRA